LCFRFYKTKLNIRISYRFRGRCIYILELLLENSSTPNLDNSFFITSRLCYEEDSLVSIVILWYSLCNGTSLGKIISGNSKQVAAERPDRRTANTDNQFAKDTTRGSGESHGWGVGGRCADMTSHTFHSRNCISYNLRAITW